MVVLFILCTWETICYLPYPKLFDATKNKIQFCFSERSAFHPGRMSACGKSHDRPRPCGCGLLWKTRVARFRESRRRVINKKNLCRKRDVKSKNEFFWLEIWNRSKWFIPRTLLRLLCIGETSLSFPVCTVANEPNLFFSQDFLYPQLEKGKVVYGTF